MAFDNGLGGGRSERTPRSCIKVQSVADLTDEIAALRGDGNEAAGVVRRVVSLVVEPQRRHVEVFVDENGGGSLKWAGLDGVYDPPSRVRQGHTRAETRNLECLLKRLVGVPEHQGGRGNGRQLAGDLREERTGEIALETLLGVRTQGCRRVVALKATSSTSDVGQEIAGDAAGHPPAAPPTGCSFRNRRGKGEDEPLHGLLALEHVVEPIHILAHVPGATER